MTNEEKRPFPYNLSFNVWDNGRNDVNLDFHPVFTLARLNTYFASTFQITEERIHSFAVERELELSEAEAELTRLLREDKKRCLEHVQSLLEKELDPTLKEAIKVAVKKLTDKILKQTLDDLSPQLNLPLKETLKDIEKLAVSPVKKFHAERIGVRWRGRPQNSKTRKAPSEARRKTADNKKKVLDAINKLYREGRNKDLKPETKKAVAEAIGISSKTLSTWIRDNGWKWEKLVAEGARGNRNSK